MKKLMIITFFAALVLSSCSKEELITVNGIAQGYVKDYYNTEYLTDATITYQLAGETLTTTTDATGFFSISGLSAGEFYLYVSKSGYLSQEVSVWIEPLYDVPSAKDGGSVDYVQVIEANLPELSASVNGVIKKTVGPNNVVMPAVGQVVTIQSDWDYFPRLISTTTNADGVFIFEDAPAGYVQFYVYPESDADNYYQYSYGNSYYLHPGQSYTYNFMLNRNDAGIYLTSTSLDGGNGTYRRDVTISEDLVLNFNSEVSPNNTIDFGTIALTGVVLDPNADIDFSGNQVTIDPPAVLAPDTDYTLSFTVYSLIPGDYTSGSITFHTAP